MSAALPDTRDLQQKLRQHFGFRDFRPGQAQAVRAALGGQDVLVVMPTGSGKSVCFQLPALELKGTTVVVGPLLSLMKDQVDRLNAQGIPATAVNSTLTAAELREAEMAIATGRVDFIYTTPERMARPEFRTFLKQRPVDLFVVDEAHCVSQWGHDFRPDYLALGAAIDDLRRPAVLALTATATDEIIADVIEQLRIPDAEIVHTGFYRPNLNLSVERLGSEAVKDTRLMELIPQHGPGIIYAATTGVVARLAGWLEARGHSVASYHGRMPNRRRTAAQDRFMAGQTRIVVATNAFGLGIDKPDIRFIIHYHVPGALESYYQECGRAGRDGQPSECTLLYDPTDLKLQRFLQAGSYPDDADLVNAHHALQRAAAESALPDYDEVQALSPLSKKRLKVCLAIFESRGVVRRERRNQYRLLRPEMSREQLAALGQSYREREERNAIRQQRMREYAESSECRWRYLLEYFDPTDVSVTHCGHCDRCS